MIYPLVLILISSCTAQSLNETCVLSVCYQNVNTSHSDLDHLLKRGETILETQLIKNEESFEDVLKNLHSSEKSNNKLHNSYKNLSNLIEDLQNSIDNYSEIKSTIDDLTLGLQSHIVDNPELTKYLEKIKNHLRHIELIADENIKTFDQCKLLNSSYEKYENLTNELFSDYTNIDGLQKKFTKRMHNLQNKITASLADSVTNQNEFGKINNNFLDNDLNAILKKIATLLISVDDKRSRLHQLFSVLYVGRKEFLENLIQKARAALFDLSNIEIILDEYDGMIPKNDYIFVTDPENRKVIDEIYETLEILTEKIKRLQTELSDIYKEELRILELIRQHKLIIEKILQDLDDYKLLINFYNLIVKRIREIELEILRAKQGIHLMQKRESLREDLEGVRKIYDQLRRYPQNEICFKDRSIED